VVEPTPLKNGVKVSWDSVIPNMWKNKNVPNHQSDGDLAHMDVLMHASAP
jgi:hypothetical protein